MLYVSTMTRAQLEIAIIDHEILEVNTVEGLDKIGDMTDDELREVITNWVEEEPEEWN